MNIKLLLFALSGLVGFNANAQSNPRNPITTGFKAGLNLSNLSAGKNSQEIKPSFHVGGLIEFPLSYYKQFAVQLEIQYSNQGYNGKEYEIKDEVTGSVIEKNKLENVSLHYVNIPIMFKYYVSDNFSIELGPQLGFLMDASGSFDLFKYNPSRKYISNYESNIEYELIQNGYVDNNYRNYYEKIDYGISAGISYNFENGMFLSGRYYFGLNDIYKKDNGYSKISIPEGTPDDVIDAINKINKDLDFTAAKNSVIQISVGYRF